MHSDASQHCDESESWVRQGCMCAKVRFCILLTCSLVGTLSGRGAVVSALPPLTEELRPLVEVSQPTLEDAKQCIQALTTTAALKGSPAAEFNSLVDHIKKPFVVEAGFLAQQAAIPRLQQELASAQQKLEGIRRVPPRDIRGNVNELFWQLMQNKASDVILAAEARLKAVNQAKPALARQLAATNSDILTYLRAGRADIALALASSMFAVQHREQLTLDFEPALSRYWVAMKKLDPVSRQLEQEKARKELIAWVAMNINARNVTRAGINSAMSGLRDDKAFWEALGSAELIAGGMQAERQTELMISVCLEVIFFQPQPGDDARQVRLAMQRMLSNRDSQENGTERFGKQAVENALTAVDPKLGRNPAVVESAVFIMQAGYDQSRAAAPSPPKGVHTSGTFTGTGFFITADGYLVTNHHVVAGARAINVLVGLGQEVSADIVASDKKSDLAILKITGDHSCLPVAQSNGVRLGSTVITVGFPNPDLQGFSPKQARGEIAGLAGIQDDTSKFQISVPIQPGNSGGALVDEQGNVVGVVCSILNQNVAIATTGTIANSVAYAVKSNQLLNMMESISGLADKLVTTRAQARPFVEIVEAVNRATVRIEVQK